MSIQGNIGLVQGFNQGMQQVREGMRHTTDTRRAMQEMANKQSIYSQTSSMNEMKLEKMEMELKALRKDNAKKSTFESLSAYQETGDVKYLNEILAIPELAKSFQGVSSWEKLDVNNEAHQGIMAQIGLDADTVNADPKRYTVVNKNGKKHISDIYGAYAKTGYLAKMKQNDLDAIVSSQKKLKVQQEQVQLDTDTAKYNAAMEYQKAGGDMNLWDWDEGRPVTAAGPDRRDTLLQVETAQQSANDARAAYDKNPTKENFEALQDAKVAEMKLTGGAGLVRHEREAAELSQAENVGKQLLAGTPLDANVDRSRLENNVLLSDKGKYIKKQREEFDSKARNVEKTTKLAKDIEAAVNSETVKTGIWDSAKQYLAKITPEGFHRLLGLSEKEIIEHLKLEGRVGQVVAAYLKDMSGTAASEQEAQRTLNYIVGSKLIQEGYKVELFNTFTNELREDTVRLGKSLVTEGLVGNTYDKLQKVTGGNISTAKSNIPVGTKARNPKTGETVQWDGTQWVKVN